MQGPSRAMQPREMTYRWRVRAGITRNLHSTEAGRSPQQELKQAEIMQRHGRRSDQKAQREPQNIAMRRPAPAGPTRMEYASHNTQNAKSNIAGKAGGTWRDEFGSNNAKASARSLLVRKFSDIRLHILL